MAARIFFALALSTGLLFLVLCQRSAPACCPAPPSGKPVVNADQTVVIVWDAAAKKQHFIRQASFKSDADDFGFLVPTPNQPELEESGNDVFPYLMKLTAPEKQTKPRPSGGIGCGGAPPAKSAAPQVRVLDEKLVAGFHAAVLEATSAEALVAWLKEHNYAFSPEVEAWAQPYIDAKWKITALKVARDPNGKEPQSVAASSLRLSFKTDRPLFPYREPDSTKSAETLGAKHRLLRIYFVADARYEGELTPNSPWSGKVAWANPLTADERKQVFQLLKLPEPTGTQEWWLTEFEDHWPYQKAPADVYFSRAQSQDRLKRPPIILYVSAPVPTDVTIYALGLTLAGGPLALWVRRRCA